MLLCVLKFDSNTNELFFNCHVNGRRLLCHRSVARCLSLDEHRKDRASGYGPSGTHGRLHGAPLMLVLKADVERQFLLSTAAARCVCQRVSKDGQ
jgi:hypothetical protein